MSRFIKISKIFTDLINSFSDLNQEDVIRQTKGFLGINKEAKADLQKLYTKMHVKPKSSKPKIKDSTIEYNENSSKTKR